MSTCPPDRFVGGNSLRVPRISRRLPLKRQFARVEGIYAFTYLVKTSRQREERGCNGVIYISFRQFPFFSFRPFAFSFLFFRRHFLRKLYGTRSIASQNCARPYPADFFKRQRRCDRAEISDTSPTSRAHTHTHTFVRSHTLKRLNP